MLTAAERNARRRAMNRKRNMQARTPSKTQMTVMNRRLHPNRIAAQNKQIMSAFKALGHLPNGVRNLIIKNIVASHPYKRKPSRSISK